MTLRVAVVGAGYLGQHHARIYSELSDVELAAVVDVDEGRAIEVAGRCSTRACRDYKEVLESVDALSIVVPTTSHFETALDCIRAGKDVLVEKPLTATVAEADELIEEAEKKGCIIQVGHLERYNPGLIALTGLVEEPRFLEATRVSPFPNRGLDVDVTLDLMIHDIDIIMSLVPHPVRSIDAFGFSLATEKADEARVWMGFENGAAASLFASRIFREKQRRLRVFQKDSCIELDYQTSSLEVRSPSNALEPQVIRPEYREPLKEELKDFIRNAVERKRPKVSGIEGRNALKTVLEINSAMGRNR